jgi:hypothetical protein
MGEKIGEIRSGSKDIELRWDEETRTFGTYIHASNKRDRQPNETTEGYRQAVQVFQERANREEKPVTFQFSTSREILQKWAEDPKKAGEIIGQWDEIERKGKLKMYKKFIYPTKSRG